jgi:pimeloyl-ACP methyl ester carboxylesterase
MKMRTLIVIGLCFLVALLPVTALAQPPQQSPGDAVTQRRDIDKDGRALSAAAPLRPGFKAATGSELATALDVIPSLLVNATVSGPAAASAVFPTLGVIQPKLGDTLVVLSTGVAGSSAPEPGFDFDPVDVGGDQVVLTLVLNVPAGTNRLSFDYNFLSAESPDYIGSIYNDTFAAILTDANGVREIARSSVNSAAFIPVSATNAGGSGFDLFTENPSGVDTSFGGGLPDAGVTGFRNISVEIAGDGQVTLEFLIEDRGDGILDSAVVLDGLVLTALEAVDPNPALLANGNLISDRTRLAQEGEPVEGAAADGVTKVLLRTKVAALGNVEFCLDNATAPQDGGLALLGASGRNTCVTATVEQVGNEFVAFAVYQVPEEFNRGSDDSLAERPLAFKATYQPTNGNAVESKLTFKLVRPPVMLIHGLWSGPGTWTFPLVTDARFIVEIANYESTHAAYFAVNSGEPGARIKTALTKLRLKKIAATQADVAGHSMGGLLSRLHVQSGNYKNNLNFNQGDINKLITLNTPHTGSPLANLIQGIRAIPLIGGAFESAMAYFNHPVDQGAPEDLAKGSTAINAIQQTAVPSHALVGIGGSDALELIPGRIGQIYAIINFFANYSDVFQGLQHDGIVGRESQEGGLPANAYTVFGGFGSIHTAVTGNTGYSNRVITLYNSAANSALFSQFPPPSSVAIAADASTPALIDRPATATLMVEGLTITTPADGASASAGTTISVTVEPVAGANVEQVLLIGPNTAISDTVAPFVFNLLVPDEAVGAFPLSAFGQNSGGDLFTANVVNLQVTPEAMLDSLTLVPQDTILFAVGESRNLSVLGLFSDAIVRDVTDGATGTAYLTSDPTIVTVDTDGLITAQGPGTATIIARNGQVQNSISVIVLLANQTPVADAGTDQVVLAGSQVNLDGSNSVDPDQGPQSLTYEWSQIAGPAVTLNNPFSPTPAFFAAEAGRYTFSLIVRDGQADSLPDSVIIEVGPLLQIERNGADLALRWTMVGDESYEVHRSTTPFFTPNATTLLATVASGTDTYVDTGAVNGTDAAYFYVVRAVAGTQNADSNEVGAIRYTLTNSGNKYSLVALPFAAPNLTNAAALATYIGAGQVSALLKWNPTAQSFRFFAPPNTGDNFALTAGDALFVAIKNGGPSQVTFVGDVTARQYPLTPGGYNFLSLPLQRANLTTAADVAADIGGVQALLGWNAAGQSFRFFSPPASGDNFAVTPGQPFIALVMANGPVLWPGDSTVAMQTNGTFEPPSRVDLALITPPTINIDADGAGSRATLYLPLIKSR